MTKTLATLGGAAACALAIGLGAPSANAQAIGDGLVMYFQMG